MGIRILKITSAYPQFVEDFYLQNLDLKTASYQTQFEHFMEAGWGWADYYKKSLIHLGAQAEEIIHNATPMQQTWARERKTSTGPLEIVLEQIKSFAPDYIFFQDALSFPVTWIRDLKNKAPSLKGSFAWCSAPYSDVDLLRFREFDFMLSCSQAFVNNFRDQGLKAHLLHHGFEKTLIERLKLNEEKKTTDVLFAGTIVQGKGFHGRRTEMILELIRSGIKMTLLTQISSPQKDLAKKALGSLVRSLQCLGLGKWIEKNPSLVRASRWEEIPLGPAFNLKLRRASKPPKFGVEFLRELARAKVSLNVHIDAAGDYAANARLFEVTGAGSCLLTDWKQNLGELFELDREVVAYRDEKECLAKIQWLLNNPEKCAEIAKAGQRRCIQDHSFAVRAKQLLDILKLEYNLA